MKRREFLKSAGITTMAAGLSGSLSSCSSLLDEKTALALQTEVPDNLFFDISLAEWSLHRTLWAGDMDHLDFPAMAADKFGIRGVEYVNQFFMDKARDMEYLAEMKKRADDHGVKSLIIMVDMEGSLGSLNEQERLAAVENHHKWIDAAAFLGCHSIRVNASGKGPAQSVADAVIDSLGRLCEYAEERQIAVVVENHGGYSSQADWLVDVIRQVDKPNCGTLPDFGNFTVSLFPPRQFDRQKGMELLMPFARGVSAKSKTFDEEIRNKPADFNKMLKIVHDAGFRDYVGIEYEGYKLSEEAGILATKHLLVKAGSSINE